MLRKAVRSIVILFLALAVAGPGVFPQQPPAPAFKDTTTMPEDPVGARIRSVLDVLNSGSVDRIKRFVAEECAGRFRDIPVEEHIGTALGLLRDTGGVDFHSVRTYTPSRAGETVVIVKDRILGGWWGLSFRFGEAPGFLITGLGLNSARPPAGPVEPPLTEKEALAEIQSVMARVKAKNWYSGTVLVARGADILLTDFAGEANKGDHAPINIDTKFNLGSMNKMFTSIAIARLVEAGKLSFDDPAGKYLDETWLPKDVTDKITVRHLITHTSGLGSYFNEVYDKSSRALFRKLMI